MVEVANKGTGRPLVAQKFGLNGIALNCYEANKRYDQSR